MAVRIKQKKSAKPVKPATVNRELDTLKSILSKAVEWKYLVERAALETFDLSTTCPQKSDEDAVRGKRQPKLPLS